MNTSTETLISNEIRRLKKLYPDLNHVKLDLNKDQLQQLVKSEIQAVYKGIKISECAVHKTALYAFIESFLKLKLFLDRQHS